MVSREVITPRNAQLNLPRTLNRPCSVGIKAGGLIFLSGMVAVDPQTGERMHGTVASETRQILANMAQVLDEAGASLADAVKINVFLYDMLEFDNLNRAYQPFFPEAPPARNVCGAALHSGMKVEIECVALAGAPARMALPHSDLPRSIVEPRNPMLNNSRRHSRPHSPGIRIGDLLFISGMVPLDPMTGESRLGPTADQTQLVFSNMAHLLESAGTSLARVVKLNVSLANMLEADTFHRVMRGFFPEAQPACTVVGMQLSNGHGVEIECVALADAG